MVPFHPRPVIQPLQWQVDIFVSLQLPHQRRSSSRNEHLQSFHQHVRTLRPPANIEPQNSKGKRRIDGSLRLLRIHPQQRKGSPPLPHQPRRVNRPKGFLQVHPGRQLRDLELSKVPFQSPAQLVLIRSPACSSRRTGDLRSRSRQISSLDGRACPSFCTGSRHVPFFTSASSTRRTAFRSADQRCSRHRLYSPEIEYLDCARSNATAPFSSTTAPAASLRKSCTVRVKACGVIVGISMIHLHSLTNAGPASVTCDHRHARPVDVSPTRLRRMWDNDCVA